MKIRGDMSVVSQGPDTDHALLAAFLEATSRIDRRALQRSVVLSEAPKIINAKAVNAKAVNLEAHPTPLEASPTPCEANATSLEAHLASLEANPASLEVELVSNPKARVAPFIFRRANLVKA
jgi:hypothetical protein